MAENTYTTTNQPPPPFPPTPARALRRSLQVALCLVALLWYVLADALAGRAARGLTNRFDFEDGRPLLSALFLIFLLTVGFTIFESFGNRRRTTLSLAAGLPQRITATQEWMMGAGIGWGMALAAVLPMAFGRSFHVRFWTEPRAFRLFALNLAALLITALAIEMGLRGYAYRRLVDAVGRLWATLTMIVVLALLHGVTPEATGTSIVVTALFALLLATAWMRTHGLWLGWGLHFAWSATIALLFGLPLRGDGGFATVVQTRAIRPTWLTGNAFGPEGAALTVLVLLAGIFVLFRLTDEYAWNYTRKEIVAAGYEVNPAPPAAHTAMEQEARLPALVQILPTTPQSRSVDGY